MNQSVRNPRGRQYSRYSRPCTTLTVCRRVSRYRAFSQCLSQGVADRGERLSCVDHAPTASLATTLARADIDTRRSRRGRFDDAARGVSDQDFRIDQAAQVLVAGQVFLDADDSAGTASSVRVDRLDDSAVAAIAVGVKDRVRAFCVLDGADQRIHHAFFVGRRSAAGMLYDQQTPRCAACLARPADKFRQPIQTGRTDEVYVRFAFSHARDAPARLGCRGKVDMGESGHAGLSGLSL